MATLSTSSLVPELRRGLARRWHEMDTFMAGPPSGEVGADLSARQGRRLLWADGLVSNVSESFITGFVHPFAIALGASNSQIGLLSALPSLLAALGLLPGARLGEQATGRKRLVVLTGGGAGRLTLLAVAAAPLLLPPPIAVSVYIALTALRGFISQLGYPAWSALVADLVPSTIRGRYFSGRNMAMTAAGLLIAPLAGWFIDLIGSPLGYQASFLVAGLLGLIATAIFSRIPEPPPAATEEKAAPSENGLLDLLRRRPRLVAFTAVAFAWNLAVTSAGPFFTVHLVRNLGATPTQIGILTTVQSLSTILGHRVWGHFTDRYGSSWVMRTTGLILPIMPLLWFIAPAPWFVGIIYTFGGFSWAGYGLANFNLLLNLTPTLHRARYVAAYQIAVFVASAAGPLIGSALIAPLTIRGLFVVSACGRLLATLLFLRTVRGDTERGDDLPRGRIDRPAQS